jgi:phospholipase/carboxylesterase
MIDVQCSMIKTDESVTAEINLYYDLHVPENTETPAPLLIAIHGYAAHKHYMMREAKLIAPENFAIVSLQAPNKFYRPAKNGEFKLAFGWLTDYKPEESVALHHKFVLDVIEKLAADNIIDDSNIFLYGFSQACALNFRFAFTNPDVLKGIIGVCGGIPSDLDENQIYHPTNAKTLYLYSDEDEFYPLEKFERFEKKLDDYLPRFQSLKYKATHEITNEMREDMRNWLENQ